MAGFIIVLEQFFTGNVPAVLYQCCQFFAFSGQRGCRILPSPRVQEREKSANSETYTHRFDTIVDCTWHPSLGLQLGVLLAGAIITEKIFSWPGIGLLLVEDGIGKRDYRVVQGCVLLISITYIVVNTLTDTIYRWLDPRIRVS